MSATSDLLARLRAHYIPESRGPGSRPGGVFAHEVSMNGAWGGPGSSRADALYAGFTSASGRILIGHEIKVSRSDWRAELAKVGKADAWADACHQWWIVAPSTDVVPPEELPEGWGLMLPPPSSRHRRMRVAVKAATKSDFSPPWWAVRSFMARLDTLEHEQRASEIRRIVDAWTAEYTKQQESRRHTQGVGIKDQLRLRTLENLESELGFRIENWRSNLGQRRISAQDLALALEIAAATGGPLREMQNLVHGLERTEQLAGELRQTLDSMDLAEDGSDQ